MRPRKLVAVEVLVCVLALVCVLSAEAASAEAPDAAARDAAGLVILKDAYRCDILVAVRDFERGKVLVNVAVRTDLLEMPMVQGVLARHGIKIPTTRNELLKAFGAGGERKVHVEALTNPDATLRQFRVTVKVRPGDWPGAVDTDWVKVSLAPKSPGAAVAQGARRLLRLVPFAGAQLEAATYDALTAQPGVAKLLQEWQAHVKVEACGRILGAKRYGAHEMAFDMPVVTKAGPPKQMEIVPDYPYTRHILAGIMYVLALGALFALAVVAMKKMARD